MPVLEAAGSPGVLELVPMRSRAAVRGFLGLLHRVAAEAAERGWSEGLALAVQESGYADWLARSDRREAEERMENVRELLNAARSNEEGGATLEGFMEHAALLAGIDNWAGTEPGAVLMTLHNAKGLEFPHVMVAGLEEGLLPHSSSLSDDDELEEERRLFYVGLTRAQVSVTLLAARGRRLRDRFMWCLPSRFLRELPPALVVPVDSPAQLPLAEGTEGSGVPASWQGRDDGEGITREPVDDGGEGEAGMRAGARVRHPRFGPGTVIQLTGAGDELNVTVSFPRWGRKTFLARLARLEPL
jgi:DNA helicase-2/ATP-dependent DNA helicase PcrA